MGHRTVVKPDVNPPRPTGAVPFDDGAQIAAPRVSEQVLLP
jgi:hypothetical protein